jgi:GTPase SAR1 family protein
MHNNRIDEKDVLDSKDNILIVGPSGCGKTTFILNNLNYFNRKEVLIIDPTGSSISSKLNKSAHNRYPSDVFIKEDIVVVEEYWMLKDDEREIINGFLNDESKKVFIVLQLLSDFDKSTTEEFSSLTFLKI